MQKASLPAEIQQGQVSHTKILSCTASEVPDASALLLVSLVFFFMYITGMYHEVVCHPPAFLHDRQWHNSEQIFCICIPLCLMESQTVLHCTPGIAWHTRQAAETHLKKDLDTGS